MRGHCEMMNAVVLFKCREWNDKKVKTSKHRRNQMCYTPRVARQTHHTRPHFLKRSNKIIPKYSIYIRFV